MIAWLSSMASRLWQGQRLARIQPDPYFTDPAMVEDDYWRMRPEPAGRR
jgi:hypothetical protein